MIEKMEKMFIEIQSLYDFDQTVETLSETILSNGWKISMTHDLQGTLIKSGIEVLPVKVIELAIRCWHRRFCQIVIPECIPVCYPVEFLFTGKRMEEPISR